MTVTELIDHLTDCSAPADQEVVMLTTDGDDDYYHELKAVRVSMETGEVEEVGCE